MWWDHQRLLCFCLWNWKVIQNLFGKLWLSITCRNKTKIDGGWSEWSEWSKCHANCRNTRNRTCNNPTPLFGGQNCSSHFEEEESPFLCYGDDCCPSTSDYIGCFQKKDGLDMYRLIPDSLSVVDPCYCIGYCNSKNTSLAAVNWLHYCLCGDEPGTRVDDSKCSKTCNGDNSFKCGGYNSVTKMGHFSVYGTGR